MSTDVPDQRRKYPRPAVVTLSCVFIAVTAFLTLTDLISALLDWGTVDMQDALKPAVREMHRGGLDWTMPELLGVLRWVALGLVLFVVSTLVFAVFALRGDRSARVFTTIFAVGAGAVSLPLGLFGILQAAMLFTAAGALWSPSASRWWRDEPDFPVTTEPGAVVAELLPPPPSPAEGDSSGAPITALPPPPPLVPPAAVRPPGRPASVLTASLVTILGSLAAAAFAAGYILIYLFARSAYIESFNAGPFKGMVSAHELRLIMTATLWVSIAILPVALTGLLGAIALLARRPVGRAATLVRAWIAGLMGLILFPIGLLATAGAGTVIVLLLRDDARAWTAVHH